MNARDFRNIMLGAVVAVSGLSTLAAIEPLAAYVARTPAPHHHRPARYNVPNRC